MTGKRIGTCTKTKIALKYPHGSKKCHELAEIEMTRQQTCVGFKRSALFKIEKQACFISLHAQFDACENFF